MGFRTVTHESNAYPGMTTRLIAKTADKVLLAVPEAAAHLECRREPIVTGSPVREEILFADRAAGHLRRFILLGAQFRRFEPDPRKGRLGELDAGAAAVLTHGQPPRPSFRRA